MENKTITYVVGALLIAMGVLLIMNPDQILTSIVTIGGAIIIGFSTLGVLLSIFGKNPSSSYFLGSSILGLVFGIILVGSADSAIKVVPILLGLWLFITGLSTMLYMSKLNSSLVQMTAPITRMILGLICFLAPVIPIKIAGIYIGIVLVLSGINTITNVKNEEVIYKVKVKK